MAGKTNTFDMVILRLGYTDYIMPREAALAFLNACSGSDIYKHETRWSESKNLSYIQMLSADEMPSVKVIGPVQFHQGLENYRMEQEKKNAKPTE